MSEIYGITLGMEAELYILGYRKELEEKKSTTVAILRCLFQARKIIAMRWQLRTPPVVRDWISAINETICKEKAAYIKRGYLKEYNRMWMPWVEKNGIPP